MIRNDSYKNPGTPRGGWGPMLEKEQVALENMAISETCGTIHKCRRRLRGKDLSGITLFLKLSFTTSSTAEVR